MGQIVQPLHNRILIQRLPETEQIGSIYIPETVRQKAVKGIVIAVGEGKWHQGEWWKIKGKWEWLDGYREQPWVIPGQTVYFSSQWNDAEQLPADMHLVQFQDLLGVVPDA